MDQSVGHDLARRQMGKVVFGSASGLGLPTRFTQLVEPASVRTQSADPLHQLRIYELFPANEAAFHARFRDHVTPIMRRLDFDIVASWKTSSDGRPEFAYLLRWPDEPTMHRRWAEFMADAEWSAIKDSSAAAHGQMVGLIQDRVLRPTDAATGF